MKSLLCTDVTSTNNFQDIVVNLIRNLTNRDVTSMNIILQGIDVTSIKNLSDTDVISMRESNRLISLPYIKLTDTYVTSIKKVYTHRCHFHKYLQGIVVTSIRNLSNTDVTSITIL